MIKVKPKHSFLRFLASLSVILLLNAVSAQSNKVDSLKLLLKNAGHDTTKCLILKQLYAADPSNGIEYMSLRYQIAENALRNTSLSKNLVLFYKRNMAGALTNIGTVYGGTGENEKSIEYSIKAFKVLDEIKDKSPSMIAVADNAGLAYVRSGEFQKALDYFFVAAKVREETGDKIGYAKSLSNIGQVYHESGNILKGLEYLNQSLRLHEQLGDAHGAAGDLTNIANIYREQKEFEKAIENYNKSLKILESSGGKEFFYGITLNNIGLTYSDQGNNEKAMEYFSRSLSLFEKMENNDIYIANTLNNIGNVYFETGNFEKAMELQQKALKLQREIGAMSGQIYSLKNIGSIYYRKGDMRQAQKYCEDALRISKELGAPKHMINVAEILSGVYKSLGNYKGALETYELYITMRDSIANEENKKASIKNQLNYEYEKKAAADSVKTVEEKKVVQAQLKQEQTQRYSLLVGLLLVVVFAVFMVNRFRITNKQKKLIEEQKKVVEGQKNLVEEKQREILDSIHYAKRIQTALMSSEYYIDKELKRLNNHIHN